MTEIPAVDGRSALREQRGRMLVEAARSLATSHGPDGFTVEQVAELAGVSRRTVFNHFGGLEQLLVAVCDQVLAEVIADLLAVVDDETAELPRGEVGYAAAIEAVGGSVRRVDLPTAIATLHRVLGGPEPHDERSDRIARTAFDHVAVRLRERLRERAPDLDALDVEIGLALLTHGIATISRLWVARHPDLPLDVPPDARTDWDRLLDRLLLRLGTTPDTTTDPERSVPRHG